MSIVLLLSTVLYSPDNFLVVRYQMNSRNLVYSF